MSVIIQSLGGGGGKIIKDATATPEDVRQGKIFYNNNGKQAGTLKCKEVKSFTLSKGEEIEISHGGSSFFCVNYATSVSDLSSSSRSSTKGHASLIVNDIKAMIGVECKGIFYDLFYVNVDLLPRMLGPGQYNFNSVQYWLPLCDDNSIRLSYHHKTHTVIAEWQREGADALTVYYI